MSLLNGVRVLELGTVAMAPYAGQWLADLGADVIKVEAPEGDSTRRTGPTTEPNMAAMFLGLNRNKRSIVLDLKTSVGKEALSRLVGSSDIFMHNMRPQKILKLGFGPADALKLNSRIVYASLHGYGENGPYSGRPAYDDIIQGASGIASLVSQQSGTPNYFPTIIADKTTGLNAVIAILAALVKRNATDAGLSVEVPMFEAMVAFTAVEHLYGAAFEPLLTSASYPRLMSEHRRPYATQDGYLCVMPYTDGHWRDFFAAADAPESARDPRFRDIDARTKHIAELYALAAQLIASKTSAEWERLCAKFEIPCSSVRSMDELIDDQHLRATGFFSILSDRRMGNVRFPGVPVTVGGERPGVRFPPRLGEHTREILKQVDLPDALIEEIERQQQGLRPANV